MLELHVENNDVTGGSIGVGWCVSPDTLNFLAKNGYKNPAVVLCTAPSSNEEKYDPKKEFRKVVNLKDLVGYVEFRSPGTNNIWGFIASDEKKARNKFLAKWSDGTGYRCDILSVTGDEWRYYPSALDPDPASFFKCEDVKEFLLAEPVEVNVPKACFAPEPAKWEKIWVNHFSGRDAAVDQCEFRRRRLFAYTIQPVLMLFSIFIRLFLFLFAAFLGSRGTSIAPVIHPLSYGLHDSWESTNVLNHGSVFLGRGENEYLNNARLIFFPPIAILLSFLLINKYFAAIFILGGAIVGGVAGYLLVRYIRERADRPVEVEIKEEPVWYLNPYEMSYIVCNAEGKKATSFKTLPPAKKTISLRFQDLKSKVCRPFSA